VEHFSTSDRVSPKWLRFRPPRPCMALGSAGLIALGAVPLLALSWWPSQSCPSLRCPDLQCGECHCEANRCAEVHCLAHSCPLLLLFGVFALGVVVGGLGLLAWRIPAPVLAAPVEAVAPLLGQPVIAAQQGALQDGRARGPHSGRA